MDIREKKASKMSEMIDKTSSNSWTYIIQPWKWSKGGNVQKSIVAHENLIDSSNLSPEAVKQNPSPTPESIGERILGYVLKGLNVLTNKGVPSSAVAEEANKAVKTVSKELEAKSERLDQNADKYLERADNLKQKISDYIQNRASIIDELKAKGYSEQQIDEIVSFNDQKVSFNVMKCEALMKKAEALKDRSEGLKQVGKFLAAVSIVTNRAGNHVAGIEEVMDSSMEAESTIIKEMTPAEVAQSQVEIAQIDSYLHEIAGGREDLLAKVSAHNIALSNVIAQKLESDESGNSAAAFIIDAQKLRDIFHEASELTNAVVKMLADNRAEQNRLDEKAAEKKADETAYLKKQDEKVDQRKIDAKKHDIKKMQKKLDQLIAAGKNDAEVKKLEAEIIDQLSRKPQV